MPNVLTTDNEEELSRNAGPAGQFDEQDGRLNFAAEQTFKVVQESMSASAEYDENYEPDVPEPEPVWWGPGEEHIFPSSNAISHSEISREDEKDDVPF